ncbi:plasmid mobilization protein [Paracoccus sp. Ld10]|uniref:plasmid mobilization protein n=1 Tax=Paracoccus sp. Ld10 TaxID=649158 RepID=UPI003862DA32
MPRPTSTRKTGRRTEAATKTFEFRLTFEEKADLERKAKAVGLSSSAFLRGLINDADITPGVDRAANRALALELSRIGTNLNQLTRHANRFRGAADTEKLLTGIAGIQRELEDLSKASFDPLPYLRTLV